ncbi:hypothetical protein [Paraburkholderia sp. 35.1]|uniref:hypothetical protein n=1 Tax=Paraburkholderia sp. 35.1 TaxID=2991058 RepID=UPI003D213840
MKALLLALAFVSSAVLGQTNPGSRADTSAHRQSNVEAEKKMPASDHATGPSFPGIAAVSPSSQGPVENNEKLDEHPDVKNWLERLFEDPVALFTFVLAVSTMLLWWSTNKLWIEAKSAGATAEKSAIAAKEAADVARDSAKAYMVSERAWVSLMQVDPVRFQDSGFFDTTDGQWKEGDGWAFSMRWTNPGKTPAVKAMIMLKGECLPNSAGIPAFESADEIVDGRSTIFPNTTVSSNPVTFSDMQITGLKNRTCRIFLFGRTSYSDIFNTTSSRHTQTCVEVQYGGKRDGNDQFRFTVVGDENSLS